MRPPVSPLRRLSLVGAAAFCLLAACGEQPTPTRDASAQLGDAGADATPATVDAGPPEVIVPRTGITAAQLGVIVNDDDPISVSIAAYYASARQIPTANVVHLHVGSAANDTITVEQLGTLKAAVDTAFAGTDVQAVAITWTKPYRVDYMSITSALSLGYKPEDASTNPCNNVTPVCGPANPYTGHLDATAPATELNFRPSMALAATTLDEAKALIDRGVASDDTWPMGGAYLMHTSDGVRSARCVLDPQYGYINECQLFLDTWDGPGSGITGTLLMADSIMGKPDVLFYVQGLSSVPNLDTNTYLPGAIADHLTSFGGQIPTSGQMSCFAFLKAGATGSYGTVVEPYAFQQKFPDPRTLIPRYFGGNTLIEAYWKSVVSPGQGIFIGEPLARPFGSGFRTRWEGGALTIETTTLRPGHTYVIEAADSASGPFTVVQAGLTVDKYRRASFTVPDAKRATYRFRQEN